MPPSCRTPRDDGVTGATIPRGLSESLVTAAAHPVIKWTFAPAILLAIALWAGVYVWRFRNARAEAGGRGAGPPPGPALAGLLLGRLIARLPPIDPLRPD